MTHLSRKLFFLCTLLFCLVGFGAPSSANTGELLCAQLAERKYYKPAADCYQKEAKKIRYSKSIKEADRIRKGGFLREAARNLDRLAATEKRPEVAAFLRTKAVALLEQAIKQGLVRKKAGKRRARLFKLMRGKIFARIGYTPLAISTAQPRALIEVKGYEYSATATQKFNESLRPGPYTVRVKYPSEAVWRTRKIVLKAGSPAVLSFVKRPTTPALAWIGYTVGVAAIVAGGIMIGYGASILAEENGCHDNTRCHVVKAKSVLKAPNEEQQPIVCQPNDQRLVCRTARRCANDGFAPACALITLFTRGSEEKNSITTPGYIFVGAGSGAVAVGVGLLIAGIVAQSRTQNASPKTRAGKGNRAAAPNKWRNRASAVLFSSSL